MNVDSDRSDRHEQLIGNLLVGTPTRKEFGHLTLPAREQSRRRIDDLSSLPVGRRLFQRSADSLHHVFKIECVPFIHAV